MIADAWQLLLSIIWSDAVVQSLFLAAAGCAVFSVFCLLAEAFARVSCWLEDRLARPIPEEPAEVEIDLDELLAEENLPALLRRQAS